MSLMQNKFKMAKKQGTTKIVLSTIIIVKIKLNRQNTTPPRLKQIIKNQHTNCFESHYLFETNKTQATWYYYILI